MKNEYHMSYLGRQIDLYDFSRTTETIHCDPLESMFLFASNSNSLDPRLRNFFKVLSKRSPLGLMFIGVGGELCFDLCLSYLSASHSNIDTMTKFNDSDDIEVGIEEFFQSFWPTERRFDEWKKYCVINIGYDFDKILASIKTLADESNDY